MARQHSWRPRADRSTSPLRRGFDSKHKAGDFEARNWDVSRYLVYLNNRAAGKGSVKTIALYDQKTAPLTPKSFIYNRRSYSQAGRRGFDPRLPLHKINSLGETSNFLHSISLS